MGWSKRKSNIRHTQKRFKERFGLDLSKEDVIKIGRIIRNGNSEFVKGLSNARRLHVVNYKGTDIAVVYGNKNKVPITVFPPKWIKP
jgi:hypothetical protein